MQAFRENASAVLVEGILRLVDALAFRIVDTDMLDVSSVVLANLLEKQGYMWRGGHRKIETKLSVEHKGPRVPKSYSST